MVLAAAREDKPTVAVILMFVAVFLFTLIESSAKWLILYGLPAVQVIFARYCGAFLVLILLFIPRRGLNQFVSNNPKLQFIRAIALLGSTTFNFLALKFLPITTTIAIFFAMPLAITILGYFILNEKVGLRRFTAVFVGFLGVLVIIQPWSEDFHWAMILSVTAMLFASSYFILTRLLAGQDNNSTSQLWSSGVATFAIAPFALQDWHWPQTNIGVCVLLIIGILGATSHILATRAHLLANASTLAPTIYVQVIYATVMGYFIFNTLPSVWTGLGTVIIVGSGLFIWKREITLRQAL
jgi:drug/metabolite transporter (DMT)-like permease